MFQKAWWDSKLYLDWLGQVLAPRLIVNNPDKLPFLVVCDNYGVERTRAAIEKIRALGGFTALARPSPIGVDGQRARVLLLRASGRLGVREAFE